MGDGAKSTASGSGRTVVKNPHMQEVDLTPVALSLQEAPIIFFQLNRQFNSY